ncbi:YcxB family protein [Neobacillus sp. PS2-9]|uniref:YcxB family protein n=1 Tax=Neobacillus sp. PS2-9 TaxID=3070676 RepID=UPI0027DFEEF0|nr:YcxB family protein [Neobacillus sp. PS2-9]WML55923.1 YcxB family protein [Neobacillus sp. PS2-9]
MEITYNLTEEDFLHFNMFHLKHSKSAIQSLNVQRFLTPVFFILMAFLLSEFGNIPFLELFIVFLITSILWIIFYPWYFYNTVTRRMKKMFKEGKNVGLLGEHVLTLNEEGLVESSANGQIKVNWSGITDYKEDEQYFYLYNSSVSAYIIPKRDLNNSEEVENFLKGKVSII